MWIAVYHNLPSGGAKRTLQEQVKRLSKDHRVHVFTLSCAEHEFADLQPFCDAHKVFPFTPLPLFRSPFGRLNQLVRIADLVRLRRVGAWIARRVDANAYDVALVHPCQYTNSPAILRYLRTPNAFYCQERLRLIYDSVHPVRNVRANKIQSALDFFDPLPKAYRRFLAAEDRANLKSADRVLVNSEFSRASLASSYGISPRVCYHGVDTNLFRPLNLPKEQFVLSVGALRPNKGFDFIVEGLARLDPAIRPALKIVSNYIDPLERTYLEKFCNQVQVSLHLSHLVDDETLCALYNRTMLTVYAPVLEPFGLVPLESMACGTPVVAVGEGGVCETVVDNVTGRLTPRDSMQFAESIRWLLENPGIREQYGKQAREYVMEKWTWEKATMQLTRHLADVADRKNA